MSNICNFFVKGNCRNGNECKFIHDKNICRFHFLGGYCKRGNTCLFSHEFIIKCVGKNDSSVRRNHNKTSMKKLVTDACHKFAPEVVEQNNDIREIDPIEEILIDTMKSEINRFREENGEQMSYSDMRRLFG